MIIETIQEGMHVLYVGPLDNESALAPERSVEFSARDVLLVSQNGTALDIYLPPLRVLVRGEPEALAQLRAQLRKERDYG